MRRVFGKPAVITIRMRVQSISMRTHAVGLRCGFRWLTSWSAPRDDIEEHGDSLPVPGLIIIGELNQFFDVEASIDESFGINLQGTMLPEKRHAQVFVNVRANDAFGLKI